MKRDFVCCLRLFVDSLPKRIRNSSALFKLACILFDLPPSLFYFREQYKSGLITNLNMFYEHNSLLSLRQISQNTDVNSFHLRLIKKYFRSLSPGATVLDAGCGTGYLAGYLRRTAITHQYVGIDLCIDKVGHCDHERYVQGDLLAELKLF